MLLQVMGRNKETQEDEVFDLKLRDQEINCFYKDQYGVAVSTKQGKVYRVTQTLTQLLEQYGLYEKEEAEE